MPNEKQQRTVYLDLLRLLAMVGVVGIHVTGLHFSDTPLDSVEWRAMNLWDGLVRWAVPMFAMVSGAVFLDPAKAISAKSIFRKYLPRILLAYAFWSAIYAAIECGGSLRVFTVRFFNGHYHMWYLYMLAGVYLIVPILRRITRETRLTWYFLALSAVFTFAAPDLVRLAKDLDPTWELGVAHVVSDAQQFTMFHLTLGFVPYFVLGYALHARKLTRRETLALCALAVVGFVIAPILNARHSMLTGEAQTEAFSYNKFCVLFQTAGVFAAVKACAEKLRPGAQKAVIRLAAYSFGVYLAHPLLLDHFVPSGIVTRGLWTYLTIPALVLLVAAGGTVISAALRWIPWLGKRIT